MTSEFNVSDKNNTKELNMDPTSLPTLPKHLESLQVVPGQLAGTNAPVQAKGGKGKAAQLPGLSTTGFDRTLLGGKKRYRTRLWH